MSDVLMEIALAIGRSKSLPNHVDRAREVVRAIEAAGWKVVPVETTLDMRFAAVCAMDDSEAAMREKGKRPETPFGRGVDSGLILACNSRNTDAAWAAMIKAAPTPGDAE